MSLVICYCTSPAGMAYLGVAALVADIVLVRFLSESEEYKKQKTLEYTMNRQPSVFSDKVL